MRPIEPKCTYAKVPRPRGHTRACVPNIWVMMSFIPRVIFLFIFTIQRLLQHRSSPIYLAIISTVDSELSKNCRFQHDRLKISHWKHGRNKNSLPQRSSIVEQYTHYLITSDMCASNFPNKFTPCTCDTNSPCAISTQMLICGTQLALFACRDCVHIAWCF